jgi:hypothetical protein
LRSWSLLEAWTPRGLNDYVEAGEAKRLDGGGGLRQLSLCGDEEIQALEMHVRAQTQLTPWLAIRGLLWTIRRAKGPYLVCQLLVFRTTN